MEPREFLQQEIRAMAASCAVCEHDVLDAIRDSGADIALDAIAHPEDAFAVDLMKHRRERHRDRVLQKIALWMSLHNSCC